MLGITFCASGKLGLSVERQIHTHLVPESGQRSGQRPHHIRQASGLGKRHTFRSDKNNMHEHESPDPAPIRSARIQDASYDRGVSRNGIYRSRVRRQPLRKFKSKRGWKEGQRAKGRSRAATAKE